MWVIKCDLCKKNIKGEPIAVRVGVFPKAELCEKCGSPISRFLKRHKFIETKKIKRNKK